MVNSFKTFLKHTAKDFHNQSVNPPVVRASTIIFKSMKDIRKTQAKAIKNPTGGHYDYGRQGTSTTYILQKILTKLEESYHVFTTPTGFGAVFLAIFSVTRPGDEIIAADPVYSPTRLLTENFYQEAPSWSPNGRLLIYYRETKSGPKGEGFSASLWSIDITGYNERKINTETDASDPSWSTILSN